MDIGKRLDLGLTEAAPAGDSCCGGGACAAPASETAGTTQEVLAESVVMVRGMTCGHCVSSVTEELSELPGVEGVSVELRVGGDSRVTIAMSAPVGDDRIRSAIEEAGYAVAGSTGR